MDSLEYIDNYFKGLLTDEEKRQFEERIHADPSFAEDVAFYVSAGATLKEELAAEKKTRFKALYEQSKDMPGHIGTSRRQAPVRRIWSYAAAAAVLIVAVGVWLVLNRPAGPEKLAGNYISEQLQQLPVQLSGDQDSLQKAIGLYNQQKLPEALAQFEQILSRDKGMAQARLYAGISGLRLGNYDKALEYFRQGAADTALYSNPAQFYVALTLMKRNGPGDAQNARQLLQEIVDRNLDMKTG